MGFRINRVYTRSGDDGMTGLVGGGRVLKSHPRVAAFGAIDELNAALGVAKEALTPKTTELSIQLELLQQELFDLGSELATPEESAYEGMWRVGKGDVERLELLCDTFNAPLAELASFILPGGSPLAAHLHMARTIARRAERELVGFRESGFPELNPFVIPYLNRLNDLLFILSRWALFVEGKSPPLWIKASERGKQN